MPEGPEVRRVTDKLRSRLKGRTLLWIDILPNNKYTNNLTQWWGQFGALFPSTCLEIICRGKQIFFFFENQIAFYGGLGMFGHWFYFTSKDEISNKALQKYTSEKNHARFALHFGKSSGLLDMSDTVIWYDDTQSQGNFTITTWSDAVEKMKEIGPDLLATSSPFRDIHPAVQPSLPQFFFERVTLELFSDGLREPRRSQIALCKFLMEQKYFSGIGNYLKSEILYRARLNPFRLVSTLTDDEISRLYGNCLTTIQQAYQSGGLTHGTFLDPDMEKGTFPVFVYKRAGEKDPHGFTIVFIPKDQSPDKRGTYYVPELQPFSPSLVAAK